MKITFVNCCLWMFFVSSFCLFAKDGQTTSSANIQAFYNIQDRPSPQTDNPIKGISNFLFFPMYPAKDKKTADDLFALIEKKLIQYGDVNHTKILVQTDQGEAVDLSVFKTGATLIYKIENLKDLLGNDTGIVRASLNFYTEIEITKTKELCSPYIWSCNCFLKGSTKKEIDKLISLTLDNLLEQFSSTYKLVNKGKPVFELQGAS